MRYIGGSKFSTRFIVTGVVKDDIFHTLVRSKALGFVQVAELS